MVDLRDEHTAVVLEAAVLIFLDLIALHSAGIVFSHEAFSLAAAAERNVQGNFTAQGPAVCVQSRRGSAQQERGCYCEFDIHSAADGSTQAT